MYNADKITEPIDSWEALYDEKYSGRIALLDRSYGFFQRIGPDSERRRVDIHHHGRSAQHGHLFRRGEKRKRRHEHGVARADSPGHEGHEQCVRSRRTTDAMFRARKTRKGVFKFRDFGPHDIGSVVEHRLYPGVDTVANAPLLRGKVNKLHGVPRLIL